MVFSGIGVIVHDWSAISTDGFFQGYTCLVGLVILLQVIVSSVIVVVSLWHPLKAVGGLLVAVVIKYAGNILKGFGAAISIVISSTVSFFFLHFEPSP